VVYRGSHFDDSANTLEAGDATYVNVQVSYRVSPHLLFYVRGENLSDDRTEEIFSFGARGAAVYGGVRVEL
jgi:outer membrane cobalamin receptor